MKNLMPNIPLPKTALDTSPHTRALCQKLVPGGIPVYLNTEHMEGMRENECYWNVEKIIKESGGTIQYGWQIWEALADVMIEAEFHSVWVDPAGNYHDITPKSLSGFDRILFLPDPNRLYEGRQIDNVRVALRDDPVIQAFIESAEQYFEATNRGELADYHGELVQTQEMKDLRRRQVELFSEIIQKFYP